MDDVLSLNNPIFGDLIHRIYPKELAIKDITDAVKSVSNSLWDKFAIPETANLTCLKKSVEGFFFADHVA